MLQGRWPTIGSFIIILIPNMIMTENIEGISSNRHLSSKQGNGIARDIILNLLYSYIEIPLANKDFHTDANVDDGQHINVLLLYIRSPYCYYPLHLRLTYLLETYDLNIKDFIQSNNR